MWLTMVVVTVFTTFGLGIGLLYILRLERRIRRLELIVDILSNRISSDTNIGYAARRRTQWN